MEGSFTKPKGRTTSIEKEVVEVDDIAWRVSLPVMPRHPQLILLQDSKSADRIEVLRTFGVMNMQLHIPFLTLR